MQNQQEQQNKAIEIKPLMHQSAFSGKNYLLRFWL